MASTTWPNLSRLRLEPHPTARNQAVSTVALSAGSIVISIPSFSTVLLPSEKGRRCDTCHRLQSGVIPLRRCSGCASYWYCDTKCQNMQWRSHHKKICKVFNRFTSSALYQALAPHERLDAILLSHLVAEMSSSNFSSILDSPGSIFLSLLQGPAPSAPVPPICSMASSIPPDLLNNLFSRFGNNNFAIHSHLSTFGHGIFPLASQLFNHSCAPNAAAKYIISPSQPVRMEVVALREISKDEEICLPYLDPALLQTRRQVFELTYGFRCTCLSCVFLETIGCIPDPPEDPDKLAEVSRALQDFVGINHSTAPALPSRIIQELIPPKLLCVFHESYLANLSETFSRASHEGPCDVALDVGITLLALYVLIYPPNYPQIGVHLLEMAKTMWNGIMTTSDMSEDEQRRLQEQAQSYLSLSRDVLTIFGPEGDEDGPLQEIKTLQSLLQKKNNDIRSHQWKPAITSIPLAIPRRSMIPFKYRR